MRLERLNLEPSCDHIFIATVPDSVRATSFVFSCISGTFAIVCVALLGVTMKKKLRKRCLRGQQR